MAQVQVRCTVDNCYFWAQDNFCGADSILVTSTQAAGQYSDQERDATPATLINQIGETPAEHSQETACKTFQRA